MLENDLEYQSARSLKRIRPRIYRRIKERPDTRFSEDYLKEIIDARLEKHWLRYFTLLHRLYGQYYDFFYYLESIALTAVDCWLERPDDLLDLDIRRENDPSWYLSEKMAGGSIYVDLFSGDLKRLRDKIPYLRELGLTYLHLMPLFATRAGSNDGGYAISDYRSVDPSLGTIEDLRALTKAFRQAGISLVLDFVFNHTADEHEWAVRAQEGEREFIDYYHIYPDRALPDQYEKNLREIFPSVRRGNFTWHEGMRKWVWTTFNSYQWDLRYENPEVFRAMAAEMLFLANTGVEILRLDAVAFIWKQLGTNCENLPEAHLIIQAFNVLCRIAAPSLVFKSEAIVHPDEVVRYIDLEECQLSYNPTLMALLWESVATRETKLLKQSLSHRHALKPGTAWVNYLRGHDDIGWSFDNDDAWSLGMNPHHHRDFLNRFYTGRFEGSFAAGIPFQHNTDTGDMRICGTMASLAGLEQAIEQGNPQLIERALQRMRMLYGVIFSIGGIPLIFMGEEYAALNNYSFSEEADKAEDSRWVHRIPFDWGKLQYLETEYPLRFQFYKNLQEIIATRSQLPALRGNHMRLLPVHSSYALTYLRWHDASKLVVLANFSEKTLSLDLTRLRSEGISHYLVDTLSQRTVATSRRLKLGPYDLMWLRED